MSEGAGALESLLNAEGAIVDTSWDVLDPLEEAIMDELWDDHRPERSIAIMLLTMID